MSKFDKKLSKKACIIKSCKPAHHRLEQICKKYPELNYKKIHSKLVEIEKLLHILLIYKKMDLKIGTAIKMCTDTPTSQIFKNDKNQKNYVNCTDQSFFEFNDLMIKKFHYKWAILYDNPDKKLNYQKIQKAFWRIK